MHRLLQHLCSFITHSALNPLFFGFGMGQNIGEDQNIKYSVRMIII